MNFAERAARNEEIFRGVNERIEEGAEKYGATGRQPFHCECGRGMCFGKVELASAEYQRIVAERYRFVVIAGHEDPNVERVVERTTRVLGRREDRRGSRADRPRPPAAAPFRLTRS